MALVIWFLIIFFQIIFDNFYGCQNVIRFDNLKSCRIVQSFHMGIPLWAQYQFDTILIWCAPLSVLMYVHPSIHMFCCFLWLAFLCLWHLLCFVIKHYYILYFYHRFNWIPLYWCFLTCFVIEFIHYLWPYICDLSFNNICLKIFTRFHFLY